MAASGQPKPGSPRPAQKDSLMRNIGEFFGHIAAGIKSDPHAQPGQAPSKAGQATPASAQAKAEPKVIREEVREHLHVTPEGEQYVLRRRVIDEVEPVDGPVDHSKEISNE